MTIEITPSGTELQIATDENFTTIINTEDSGEYRTSQSFAKEELPFGRTLYARVRHISKETGASNWSEPVSFHIKGPANIVGIAIDTFSGTYDTNYIDADGNLSDKPDLSTFNMFKNIAMATMDNDRRPVTMTKFPKFYIKTKHDGIMGSYSEGKLCYWISDAPYDGFRPHPAFKRSTERDSSGKYIINDYVYIGTYMGHLETVGDSVTVLGSQPNQTVAAGESTTTRANLLKYCQGRNDSAINEKGWHMFDIWDLSLLQWLGLFWKGTFDFQTAYGTNSDASPMTGTTQAKLVFKGTQKNPEVWVDDLWSCYWQHIDLVSQNKGIVAITSPMDGTSNITFSGPNAFNTMSTTSGWVESFCRNNFTLGDDVHSLLELFLTSAVRPSPNLALVEDYYNFDRATPYLKVGGYWENGNKGGLFSLNSLNEVNADRSVKGYVATRIAKV